MSRELTTQNAQLPSLATQARAAEIIDQRVSFWPDDGTAPVLRAPLTGDEKQALQNRMVELVRELRPISTATEEKKRASQALAAMFMGFPSLRNTDNAAMVAAYLMALDDLPVSAVIKACEDVAKRRVKGTDPDFPPTGPRLYEVAQKYTRPAEGERIKIKRTLDAKVGDAPISPEERKRTAEKARAFADEMKAKLEKETGLAGEAMERKMAELNHRGIENEWTRYGMEPRFADKAKTIPISLALARMNDPELDLRCRKAERR